MRLRLGPSSCMQQALASHAPHPPHPHKTQDNSQSLRNRGALAPSLQSIHGRHRCTPGRPGGTVVPVSCCGRFHSHRHLRVTLPAALARTVSRRTSPHHGQAPCYRARTWRPAEEMTVKQIRVERPRAGRERPGREVLPRDARDPDVVRAKALARGRRSRREVTDRAVTVARRADPSGLAVPGRAVQGKPAAPGMTR